MSAGQALATYSCFLCHSQQHHATQGTGAWMTGEHSAARARSSMLSPSSCAPQGADVRDFLRHQQLLDEAMHFFLTEFAVTVADGEPQLTPEVDAWAAPYLARIVAAHVRSLLVEADFGVFQPTQHLPCSKKFDRVGCCHSVRQPLPVLKPCQCSTTSISYQMSCSHDNRACYG